MDGMLPEYWMAIGWCHVTCTLQCCPLSGVGHTKGSMLKLMEKVDSACKEQVQRYTEQYRCKHCYLNASMECLVAVQITCIQLSSKFVNVQRN